MIATTKPARHGAIAFGAVLTALLLTTVIGCQPQQQQQPEQPTIEQPAERPAPPQDQEDVDELQIEEFTVGQGEEAQPGDLVTVHYDGWLTDGTPFDSSRQRDQPFQFVLGQGQVIEGWDEGVQGMRVGGLRRLIIPPDMAYGDQGAGRVIPPGATLVFDVELLDVSRQ